jgi:hypothetical protein
MRESIIIETLAHLVGKDGKVETGGNICDVSELDLRILLHSVKPLLPVGYRFAKLPDPFMMRTGVAPLHDRICNPLQDRDWYGNVAVTLRNFDAANTGTLDRHRADFRLHHTAEVFAKAWPHHYKSMGISRLS